MVDLLSSAAVPSPCINICQLDAEENCIGCGRSLAEIAEWSQVGDRRRRQICVEAEQRLLLIEQKTSTL